MREYIDVRGTEKAYDSGRWIGRSIRTTSALTKPMSQRIRKVVGGKKLEHTIVFFFLGGSFLDLDKLIPFCTSLLIQ